MKSLKKYRVEIEEKIPVLVKEAEYPEQFSIKGADDAAELCKAVFHMDRLAEEIVAVVALNCRNVPIGVFEVFHGTVEASMISTREIFVRLFLCGATRFFLAHNHPSGSLTPSRDDIEATKKLEEAGKLMGIPMVDHLIISPEGYSSLHEYGVI